MSVYKTAIVVSTFVFAVFANSVLAESLSKYSSGVLISEFPAGIEESSLTSEHTQFEIRDFAQISSSPQDLSLDGSLTEGNGNFRQSVWDEITEKTLAGGDSSAGAILSNRGSKVPEPATMFLLGTGLAGLAGVWKRRKMAD